MSVPDTTVPPAINGPAVIESTPDGLGDICFLTAGGQLAPGDYVVVADLSVPAGLTRFTYQGCGPVASTTTVPAAQPAAQVLPVTGGFETVLIVLGLMSVAVGAGLLRLVQS